MNRRDFLGSMLAACAAPAIVRADSLMRIVPVETIVVPPEIGVVRAVTVEIEKLIEYYSMLYQVTVVELDCSSGITRPSPRFHTGHGTQSRGVHASWM